MDATIRSGTLNTVCLLETPDTSELITCLHKFLSSFFCQVLDVLCSLCVCNGVAVRSNQNLITENLLPGRDLLLQTNIINYVTRWVNLLEHTSVQAENPLCSFSCAEAIEIFALSYVFVL